eukprot:4971443-Amphidinium_carterae.2
MFRGLKLLYGQNPNECHHLRKYFGLQQALGTQCMHGFVRTRASQPWSNLQQWRSHGNQMISRRSHLTLTHSSEPNTDAANATHARLFGGSIDSGAARSSANGADPNHAALLVGPMASLAATRHQGEESPTQTLRLLTGSQPC